MKKFLSLLLTLILCLSVTAPSITYAATIKLNKSKLEIHIGETYSLKLSGASGTTKWVSSKSAVAKVSSKGKITALAEGKTTITATNNKKQYKCYVTVVSNKTVDVVYVAYIFDDSTIEEYAENYKAENPDFLDVKAYDDSHIAVTMYETDRLKTLDEFNSSLNEYLTSLITDENFDGVFTDIKTDELFQNITIYADGEKYKDSFAGFAVLLSLGIVSDAAQAINLVDVADRACNITILDNSTGEILYPTEE